MKELIILYVFFVNAYGDRGLSQKLYSLCGMNRRSVWILWQDVLYSSAWVSFRSNSYLDGA